jgi:PAS domain S-box-containing protein
MAPRAAALKDLPMNDPARLASILIVEDEAIVALDLKTQLEDMGYEVMGIADNGEEALRLARQRRPDLALMDVRLKGEMDGVEVAAAAARELQLPVLYLTSYSDPDTVQRAAHTGPYGYLTKPFELKELRAGIEVALYKSRMERRLRESERWFTATLRCVQDGVLITEADGRVRFLNAAGEAMTGWTAEEAGGRPIAQLLGFAGAQDGQTSAERALREGRAIGVLHARRLLARDGREMPVDESAAPIDDEQGHRLGAVVVLRDVTERLQHEERLRSSEQRFRSAFDHAPLGMALVSLDGHFILVNDALCRLLGSDAARLKERSQTELTHPDDVAHESSRLRELLVGGTAIVQFEKRYCPNDEAEPVYTLVSVSLLRERGDPVCYLYQVHDLTAQKKATEQLAELAAQRMKLEAAEMATRARNEFLSRMSHELRTPLNAVLGFAQLMKMQGVGGDRKLAAYTDHILQAGQHLVALVDDVLELQRSATGRLPLHLDRIPLNNFVGETLDFLAPLSDEYRVRVRHVIAPSLHVCADKGRLHQVLLNVGSNAVKYNKPGGEVLWRAEAAVPGHVRLVVEDTGCGMSPDDLARLFQPFQRLGKERSTIPGTGLGLLIARSLMEEMGGSITVASEAGVGTSVCLDFLCDCTTHR